jgi:hypothetical protein
MLEKSVTFARTVRYTKGKSSIVSRRGWTPPPDVAQKFHERVETGSKSAKQNSEKRAMSLIIRDQLVTPPTWFSSFRDLTLYCHCFLHAEILIESEDPDPYWKWIRARGGMDFVEDFVRPGTEDGVRLDVEPNFPRSVITDRIAPENVHRLIAQLKFCGGLA